VEAGTYRGDLYLDKPVHLVGVGRPILQGSGSGSVVRIRAADVTVEGFDIDGLGGAIRRDTSGIHVEARGRSRTA
jgi:nitrous oxidase accessory protein